HDLAAGRPGPDDPVADRPAVDPLTFLRFHCPEPPMRVTLTIALSGLLATSPAYAATLDIKVEVPKLNVAEYHRPYVAVWLEGADQKVAANLSVWYQQTANSEGHGTKWLPDLRQWWRKSG